MVEIDIILARHGQTRANAKRMLQGGLIDCDLDERGKQQAMMLAEGMRDYHIDWIITSNLIRSIHTAQTVAQYHPGVPFTKDARLNEVSWGELDGTSIKACQHVRTTVIGEWIEGNFDAKFPSGESAGECSARVKSAFRDILEAAVERNHTNLFLCLHGRITRVILASLIDKDLREMEKYKHTNCGYYHFKVSVDRGVLEKRGVDGLAFEHIRRDVREHLRRID